MKTFRRHQDSRQGAWTEGTSRIAEFLVESSTLQPEDVLPKQQQTPGVRSLLFLPQLSSPSASSPLCTDRTLSQLCWGAPRHQNPLRNTQLGCRSDAPLTRSCRISPNSQEEPLRKKSQPAEGTRFAPQCAILLFCHSRSTPALDLWSADRNPEGIHVPVRRSSQSVPHSGRAVVLQTSERALAHFSACRVEFCRISTQLIGRTLLKALRGSLDVGFFLPYPTAARR